MSKLHRHLITSVFTALDAIMHEGQSAEVVVGRALLAHQKWGSRDRRQFAEHVYELVRHWRWAGHLADSEQRLPVPLRGLRETEFVWFNAQPPASRGELSA